jgi:hypothetical protein
MAIKRLRAHATKVVGAAEIEEGTTAKGPPGRMYDLLRLLHKELRGVVLVGAAALHLHGAGDEPERVQILTESLPDEVLKRVKTWAGAGNVEYVAHDLGLPYDFQLSKWTFYTDSHEGRKPVLDVFNSTAYELIPYNCAAGFRVGTPVVLLRFGLIDIWAARLVLNIFAKQGKGTAGMERLLRADIKQLAQLYDMFTGAELDQLFPREYAGRLLNESVELKKVIKQGKQSFYYPARNV